MGILCLEMANGEPPRPGSTLEAMFRVSIGDIPTFDKPAKWSDEFHAFLKRLLVMDITERATADELLEDPWMNCAEDRKGMQTMLQHAFVEHTLETLLV